VTSKIVWLQMSEKLQKLLATVGLGSRRELEKWISAGRVSVNGSTAKLGDRAETDDRILVDGRPIKIVTVREC
jgi:23S rRNA pseudouridine2605 synthase